MADDLSTWWDEDAERLNKLSEAARKMAVKLPTEKEDRAFCPTGEGNGVDNSCGSGGASAGKVTREVLSSIEKTGGFTIHPVTGDSPKTGFMCATVPGAEQVFDKIEDVTEDSIGQYFAKHKDYLSENPSLHLGGWVDPDSGKVFLDLSERFEDEESAVKAGVKHNQLAIWDIANGREVRIRRDNDGESKRSKEQAGAVRLSAGGNSEADRRVLEESSRRNHGEEKRGFCPTGDGGGIDNSCGVSGDAPTDSFGNIVDAAMRSPSSTMGGGGARADSSWKKDDAPSVYGLEKLQSNPPAPSLAGVSSVVIMNGKTLAASLKETGVTLDQAAKACGNLSPESNITIAHGDLKDIVGWMGDPSRASDPEASVTVVSKQPFGDVKDAIGTAATITRTEDDELLLSYVMFSVAPEAQRDNPIAVARGLYSGIVNSINEAEKIGVDEVGMHAAGSDSNDEFKGYRIWPRLGFDGIIPRNRVTPTYSLRLGFFEKYGSNLPDEILSDKAKAEKSEGALTIQSLYETKEGQRWWEENGGPMGMFLRVGDNEDPGWQRFKRISDRVSDRDILDVLDVEWRSIREEVEQRGFCPTGEGNGIDNSCGAGGGQMMAPDKDGTSGIASASPGAGKPATVNVASEKDLSKSLKAMGLSDVNVVVEIGGGNVRKARVDIDADPAGVVTVKSHSPIDKNDKSEGDVFTEVSMASTPEGNVLGFENFELTKPVWNSGARQQRIMSIVSEKVAESIDAAEKHGFVAVTTFAFGAVSSEYKGYRLWPQFGFDGQIPSDKAKRVPPEIVLKAKGIAIPPPGSKSIPHALVVKRLASQHRDLTIQELISNREGKRWWDENGDDINLTLDLTDKSSLGYKKWQGMRDRLPALRERNQTRSFFDAFVEYRGFCPTGEGNGIDNSCGSGTAGVDNSWKKSGDDYSYSPGEGESPIAGGEDIKSLSIDGPKDVAAAMKDMKVKSLTDVVAIGGGLTRGAFTSIATSGEEIHVMSEVPVDPDDEEAGSMSSTVMLGVDEEGKKFVEYDTMHAISGSDTANFTGENAARMGSILLEKFPESLAAAEKSGCAYAKTFAMGSSDDEGGWKGYRLWPQFGFDAEVYWGIRENIPKDIVPHDDPVTIQQLISTPAGKKWWNENGESQEMTLNFKDKKSDGYKRFKDAIKLAERLKKRNEGRSLYDYLVGEERGYCPTGEGNGIDNSCGTRVNVAPDRDMGSSTSSAPSAGAGKPASVTVESQDSLDKAASVLGLGGVDDVVKISGGNVRGAKVDVYADPSGFTKVSSLWPIDKEDPDGGGKVFTEVSMANTSEGKVLGFEAFGPTGGSISSGADQQKVMSIISEKVAESIESAEEHGFVAVTTFAVGDAENQYKGYRLWPQFGFDADLPRDLAKRVPPEIVLKAKGIAIPPPGSTSIPHHLVVKSLASQHRDLTIQELISTREGDRWWDQNGDDIELKLDLTDKSSLGYKQWQKMKDRLPRLRARNETRSFFDAFVEERGFCPTGEGGGILNTCGNDDGGPTDAFGGSVGGFERSPSATKEKKGGGGDSVPEPLVWRAGEPHIDIFSESSQNNPTVRDGSGQIVSTSIPGGVPTRATGGKYEIDPVSVGRYLMNQQAEERGRPISTKDELEGDDFEYMVSGIVEQAQSAQARGVSPNFYSPEDRQSQLEEYSKLQPLMRGGKTASGFCIGEEDADGNCKESEGISPQAEFLFRAAQALTSPEATPYENMRRANQVLDSFFNEPDPKKSRLGVDVDIAGASGDNIRDQLSRLHSIIDRIGLEETRKLLSGPPIRVGDFDEYFTSRIPNSEGESFKQKNYAVDEFVPPFSIFGPKVGPFFANNMGDPEPLTADVWFTRTWGRLSGELIEKTSPKLAKDHGSQLMTQTGNIKRSVLAEIGHDGRTFRTDVAGMKKTGVIPQSVINWAEKQFKQAQKDGFPSPKNGTGTAERKSLDNLAKAIIKNQTRVLKSPSTTVMRSNMIRVMKEASARTGVPVAYLQDILWQDEQDAWGTLGSRTTTVPGEPSLYSTVIKRLVDDINSGKFDKDTGKKSDGKTRKRSYNDTLDAFAGDDDGYLSDYKGGIEQALFDEALHDVDADEFADIAIEFLRRNASEDRSAIESARDAVVELRSAGLTTVVMPNAGRDGLHVMGFDADIPPDLAETLPETLSHCKTLLDLHVSSEGRSWWEQNGRDIDVAIDLEGVQGRIFDRFTAEKQWEDIIEEGILDDYGIS